MRPSDLVVRHCLVQNLTSKHQKLVRDKGADNSPSELIGVLFLLYHWRKLQILFQITYFVPVIAVFIPINSPRVSSKGPPESPGLITASVCIAFGIENPPTEMGIDRPIPLTMPVVIVSLNPKGLPIAITATSRFEEFPNTSGLRYDNSCR